MLCTYCSIHNIVNPIERNERSACLELTALSLIHSIRIVRKLCYEANID